jgi:hypothetical protein
MVGRTGTPKSKAKAVKPARKVLFELSSLRGKPGSPGRGF